jgi:hypothetical protein
LTVLDWDGEHLPEILHTLPPGRYLIEPFGQGFASAEGQAFMNLDESGEASLGQVIPWHEATHERREDDSN